MNDKIITFIYSVVVSDKNPKKTLIKIQPQSREITCQNLKNWRLPLFDLNKKENWCMHSGKII